MTRVVHIAGLHGAGKTEVLRAAADRLAFGRINDLAGYGGVDGLRKAVEASPSGSTFVIDDLNYPEHKQDVLRLAAQFPFTYFILGSEA